MNKTVAFPARDDEAVPRLTISQMARLSRVSRDTLLYYDRIGLLAPEHRGANGYRYYSGRELLKVNVIRVFQSLGMSLKEIGALLEKRTPQAVLNSLMGRMTAIKEEQERLEQVRQLLEGYHSLIEYALDLDEGSISLRWLEEKAILVGPQNDYAEGRTLQDNIFDSYHYFQERVSPLELNYPVWSFYEKTSVEHRRWRLPDHFYLAFPQAPDKRKAGWYVVGCTRGRYGGSPRLFERLLAFIKKEGLKITGRSYVEYLLNEIAIPDPNEYLIQVSIEVGR
ncbi:MAG: MerR family transcriptional regulator [Coriobacteriales bacterium]|jgi:DNA-binding transcriptional MerR regulator|nr:MerR family transcriptional regulator [Coriobacteriales bacterium]